VGTVLVPAIPFSAFARRRTQDIVAAGPYTLGQLDLRSPVIITPPDNGGGGGGGGGGGSLVEAMMAFTNKLRNGTMDIWQSGTGPISGGMDLHLWPGTDGWWIAGKNAQVTAQRVSGRGPTRYAMQLKCGTTPPITNTLVGQKLDSGITALLSGQVCTFQAWVYNNDYLPFSPKFSLGHPANQDDFSDTLNNWIWDIGSYPFGSVGGIPLQSCGLGQWTQIAYTFIVPPVAALNGFIILLDFGDYTNTSGYWNITECDLQITPLLTPGVTSVTNIPPPELRPYTIEHFMCERYYQKSATPIGCLWSGNSVSGSAYSVYVPFPTTMVTTPTLSFAEVASVGFPNTSGLTPSQVTSRGFVATKTSNANTNGAYFQFTYTALAPIA